MGGPRCRLRSAEGRQPRRSVIADLTIHFREMAWKSENRRNRGLWPFPAAPLKMISRQVSKMSDSAISNVQHVRALRGPAAVERRRRPAVRPWRGEPCMALVAVTRIEPQHLAGYRDGTKRRAAALALLGGGNRTVHHPPAARPPRTEGRAVPFRSNVKLLYSGHPSWLSDGCRAVMAISRLWSHRTPFAPVQLPRMVSPSSWDRRPDRIRPQ